MQIVNGLAAGKLRGSSLPPCFDPSLSVLPALLPSVLLPCLTCLSTSEEVLHWGLSFQLPIPHAPSNLFLFDP